MSGAGSSPLPAQRPGYADLRPAQVLDALDAAGLRPDGRILQLNSYENRVHQVLLEDGSAVVTKFYRPGRWSDAQILEEHAFALELAEAEVDVAAPCVLQGTGPGLELLGCPPTLAVLHQGGERHRFSITPRFAGREPELEDPAVLRQLGRLLGRVHAVGSRRRFDTRRQMAPAAEGQTALDTLLALDAVPEPERAAWHSAGRQAVALLSAAFDAAGPLTATRLHGDCHLGNVLWRDGMARLVDFDDACQGPAVQDLWMLVSGDALTMQAQWGHLLDGYEQFTEFDPRQRRLVEPLRTLRMIRHSAWLAERWHDPAFPAAFPFFGTAAYWSQQTQQLREQIELMSES